MWFKQHWCSVTWAQQISCKIYISDMKCAVKWWSNLKLGFFSEVLEHFQTNSLQGHACDCGLFITILSFTDVLYIILVYDKKKKKYPKLDLCHRYQRKIINCKCKTEQIANQRKETFQWILRCFRFSFHTKMPHFYVRYKHNWDLLSNAQTSFIGNVPVLTDAAAGRIN